MEYKGHTITYYRNTDSFVAACKCKKHNSSKPKIVVCTRSRVAFKSETKDSQGRPLGHLAAWLEACEEFGCKDDHKKYKKIPFADRWGARLRWREEVAGFTDLEKLERERNTGEDEEPDKDP